MNEIDPEILEIFQQESAERLDGIVEILLALESGRPPEGALNSLFRHIHSIKGSAGMVGLTQAREIGHAIEEILEGIRDQGVVPVTLVDPLLSATDALRRATTGETGIAEAAIGELARRVGGGSRHGHRDGPLAPEPEPEPASVTKATPEPGEHRSIRTSAAKVDRLLDAVGEAALQSRRLAHLLHQGDTGQPDDERVDEALGRSQVLLDELQDSVVQMRTMPLSTITGPLPRAVRDLAASRGIEVDLHITGAETQLDRMMLDGISETIIHLLRNSVAHGIEPPGERERNGKARRGRVALRAEQRGSLVAIEVHDDGRGVAPELQPSADEGRTLADVLSQAGFSTAEQVTDVSGRGVGLDAVKAHIESLGGELAVRSEPGQGTTVTLTVPLTLALLRVLLLQRGTRTFGIALNTVEEAVTVTTRLSLGGREAIELRDRSIRLIDLAEIIGATAPALTNPPQAVIVASSGRRVAVVCDRIVEQQEVVVKGLGPLLDGVAGYLGAAILGDGGIALILDSAFLIRKHADVVIPRVTAADDSQCNVLVVDDQFTVRELQRSILESAGYRVETANDGREALTRCQAPPEISLMLTDIDMPRMGGIELLRRLRDQPGQAKLPIVVMTSRADDESRRLGAEAGADAYIVKDDFNQQALLDTVQRLLTR